MSASHTSATHKKSHAKSDLHPSTPEATPPPAHTPTGAPSIEAAPGPTPAAPAPSPAAPTPASSPASKALAQLDAVESMLNLDIVVRPNDKNQVRALNRVTDTAIGLAADLVSTEPSRFADFADLPAEAAYVEVYGQVATRAQELATHVLKSVQNQRAPAANKTLALYAVVQSLGRIVDNETMREKVAALKAEIAPKRKNPKPKVTKEQKAAKRAASGLAKRVTKAQKFLADVAAGAHGAQPAPVNVPVAGAAPAATPVATATTPAAAPVNGAPPANGASLVTPH